MPSAPTSRRAEALAWCVAALAPVFLLAAAVVTVSAGSSVASALDDIVGVGFVFSVGFPVLGALVVGRQGSHAVGWLMIAIGSFEHVATAGFAVLGVLTLISMGSLLIRHRRATSDMRRQIGWVEPAHVSLWPRMPEARR